MSTEDQSLFTETKRRFMEREIADSPLLDQVCWVRLIGTRLREAFTEVLSAYKAKLRSRIDMPGGWRKSTTTKSSGEFESPMPWLHPFKLAADDLQSLEEELTSAASAGETGEKELKRLQEVLLEHHLQLPLQPVSLKPDYTPRPTRIFR